MCCFRKSPHDADPKAMPTAESLLEPDAVMQVDAWWNVKECGFLPCADPASPLHFS